MKLRHLLLALPLVAGFPIAVAVTASAQGVQIQTVMLGGNEVSPTGAASAGDPDGYGVFTATFPNHDYNLLWVCCRQDRRSKRGPYSCKHSRLQW